MTSARHVTLFASHLAELSAATQAASFSRDLEICTHGSLTYPLICFLAIGTAGACIATHSWAAAPQS